MNDNLAKDISEAAYTALINKDYESRKELRPIIIDNTEREISLGEMLGKCLRQCQSFMFSVAFISQSGLEAILQALSEAREKGVKGRLITTDYLTFSEPEALERLLKLSDFIETRIVVNEGFHTKGYLFEEQDKTTIIIGSSNLTQTALKTNREWNVGITVLESGQYASDFREAFSMLWEKALPLTHNWLNEYRQRYKAYHSARKKALQAIEEEHIETYITKPNAMQEKATKALIELRKQGKNKALIIAATGTGKTFLSCFDVKAFNPRRMLFLVHREQILKSAAESFEKILGTGIRNEIGFLTGNHKDANKKYTFSTTALMSKESVYRSFSPEYFDYIIIDEVHRAGAPSYQKIMEYFHPRFLLGMSATPDRTDHFNIYKLFDYSIACDIRLREAMENDLLCPFHYFGIHDIEVDGVPLSDKSSFSDLISEERVRKIIEKAEFYGHSGDRVKGLIFCSRNNEAEELSNMMNAHGYRTASITGATPVEKRLEYTDRLQQDEKNGQELDYIFSVDVLNEGVDIPKVNQIIMLRPTESAIIFTQQLGRGLRKAPEKDFVVVIDFIANYDKNYLIPIALSGDTSYDKDNLRRDALEGTRIIPGCSTINFDPIAREMIYQKIDEANFSTRKFLSEQYTILKNKIGRIPSISDFRKDNTIDIQRYVDEFGSYYNFLQYIEKDNIPCMNDLEKRVLVYVSKSFSDGKRNNELKFLKEILSEDIALNAAEDYLSYTAGNPLLDYSVRANLSTEFAKPSEQKGKYKDCAIIDAKTGRLTDTFRKLLESDYFRKQLLEITEDGLYRYETRYSNRYKDTEFVLFEKYTYEDICRLLLWAQNVNALNIGGYKYDERTKTLPVFINYKKEEDAISYDDKFLSPTDVIAFSKKQRDVNSSDANHIYKRTEADKDNRIFLFVRKNKEDDECKKFYFLGEMEAIGNPLPVTVEGQKAFQIHYRLETPVRSDIYDYITSSI